ncbi:unnamed protein product [Cladocopium goreaui]|uniref:Calcineurin-like phosphoesterase domain-containing protein n=1 Tax=Cladocopium goreaui TaxID=2562237 RepID=A0A9P1FD20_9DINO|nr:unnamed protein product [Cladocopium goreaui]
MAQPFDENPKVAGGNGGERVVTDSKDDREKGVAWENDLNIAGEDATLVLLTDLHHHPSYDAAISAKCLCRADAAGSPRELCKADSAPYGRLGCNAPSSLVDLSLKAAAKEEPQLWLILGDLADHWANQPTDSPYPPKAPGFTTFSDTLRRVGEASGGRCALALGNNDVFPSYGVDFTKKDFYLHCQIPADAFLTLKRYFYYSMKLGDKMSILFLNTVIYASVKKDLHASEASDPFGQFGWLEDQLKRAVKAETKVYIAGHIPPVLSSYSSTDLWQKKFVVMYWHLMSTYREVIAGQFFSHIHRDEFRVVDLKDSSPPLMLFASVSPVRDNNPAFYKLQLRKGQLSKIQGFWADLSKETPEFTREYSAPPSLVESLSNLAYRDLAFSFTDGSDEGEEKWQKFFAQSAVQRLGTTLCDNVTKFDAVSCSECIGQCRERAVCTLLYGISASSKQYCVEDQLWKKHQELKATEELMTVAEVLLFSVALLILGLCYLQYRRCKARRRRIGEDLSLAGQVELGPVDESNESNESNAAA